jgi:hypothetical protein
MHGDVDFENVQRVASFITPVPRGVGPVTVAPSARTCSARELAAGVGTEGYTF